MFVFDRPLRFSPILQSRVWGGERLRQRLRGLPGAQAPAGPIGESWELVDRPEARSVVADGPLAGKTLHELFIADPKALCGEAIDPASPDVFPLLLKLLDAREDLSVQVHPDDAYAGARKPGELGKSEAWYVLEADAGAAIYRGVTPGTDRAAFARALADGRVAERLRRLDARPGDAFDLPAGMIHALGAGVRIAEIQQNSDTTYRVFDWNRTGLDGRPRELHVEDALAVSAFDAAPDSAEAGDGDGVDAGARGDGRAKPVPLACDGCRRERLVGGEKFVMERFSAFGDKAVAMETRRSFHLWLCVRGAARLSAAGDASRSAALTDWESALIPAALGSYTVAAAPDTVLLLFHRPKNGG